MITSVFGIGKLESGIGEEELRKFFVENGGIMIMRLDLVPSEEEVEFRFVVMFDVTSRYNECTSFGILARSRMEQALEEFFEYCGSLEKAA